MCYVANVDVTWGLIAIWTVAVMDIMDSFMSTECIIDVWWDARATDPFPSLEPSLAFWLIAFNNINIFFLV